MTTDLDLAEYKAVSFDCYGTLIDWETGIAAVLGPSARGEGLDLSDEDLLVAYADSEAAVERETPSAASSSSRRSRRTVSAETSNMFAHERA